MSQPIFTLVVANGTEYCSNLILHELNVWLRNKICQYNCSAILERGTDVKVVLDSELDVGARIFQFSSHVILYITSKGGQLLLCKTSKETMQRSEQKFLVKIEGCNEKRQYLYLQLPM